MSKPTVSAAGGAMPAEGPSLRLAADAFDQTHNLIVAAQNLASAEDPYAPAFHAVVCAAEEQFEIAHNWFLERRGATPKSDPTSSEADPDPSRKLLDIADELDEVRYLIDAAWMAAGELAKEECNPIKAVLDIAERKLTAARDRLNVARGARRRASPMSDATQAEPAEGLSAEERDAFGEFQSLYRDWLAARAACVDPASDIQMKACARKLDAAELALLATPAPNPECFFEKWEVLERLVADEAEEGRLTNHRTTLALAAVKADILRLGLKHYE